MPLGCDLSSALTSTNESSRSKVFKTFSAQASSTVNEISHPEGPEWRHVKRSRCTFSRISPSSSFLVTVLWYWLLSSINRPLLSFTSMDPSSFFGGLQMKLNLNGNVVIPSQIILFEHFLEPLFDSRNVFTVTYINSPQNPSFLKLVW